MQSGTTPRRRQQDRRRLSKGRQEASSFSSSSSSSPSPPSLSGSRGCHGSTDSSSARSREESGLACHDDRRLCRHVSGGYNGREHRHQAAGVLHQGAGQRSRREDLRSGRSVHHLRLLRQMPMRVVSGTTSATQQVDLRQQVPVLGRDGFGLRVLPVLRQGSLLSLRGWQ